ncbi:hypothetical protein Hanom_Chr12g01170141 [Helianthus anomalus]
MFYKSYIVRGVGGSLVIEFITHKHQSSSAMSSTIFSSLTTFFSGGGHHSPPHPTISPQPTTTLTNKKINAVIKITKIRFRASITRFTKEVRWELWFSTRYLLPSRADFMEQLLRGEERFPPQLLTAYHWQVHY